jgi:hypothetical protein
MTDEPAAGLVGVFSLRGPLKGSGSAMDVEVGGSVVALLARPSEEATSSSVSFSRAASAGVAGWAPPQELRIPTIKATESILLNTRSPARYDG